MDDCQRIETGIRLKLNDMHFISRCRCYITKGKFVQDLYFLDVNGLTWNYVNISKSTYIYITHITYIAILGKVATDNIAVNIGR